MCESGYTNADTFEGSIILSCQFYFIKVETCVGSGICWILLKKMRDTKHSSRRGR